MKPALLIAIVFGAIAAGGGGGYVAATLATPAERVTAPRVADHADDSGNAREDLAPTVSDQASQIKRLKDDMNRLSDRLVGAEEKARQADALAAKVGELESRLKAAPASTGTPLPSSVAPDNPEFKAAVEKIADDRDERKAKEREAEQQKARDERRAAQAKRTLDTMTEKLFLSAEQQPKVKVVLDDLATKRTELMTRGQEAMQKGEQFDWRTEGAAVNKAATDALKAELTASQLSTFNELTGDRGISYFDQGWGMGTGPGSAAPGQGNGRPRTRGNGGNND